MRVTASLAAVLAPLSLSVIASNTPLKSCGDAFYSEENYTCYDSDFLCPVISGEPTLRCGADCYLPEMYGCQDGHLIYPPTTNNSATGCEATTLHLSSPPYDNYFLSNCQTAAQVVVTSPLSNSNLTYIGPRLLVAWPGGNSGAVSYFAPQNGVNGSLSISLRNSSIGMPLGPIYNASSSGNTTVGVSAQLELSSPAILSVAILGSIRTIRDFVEGPSLLYPVIQDALEYTAADGGVQLSRLWLDNITTSVISFTPTGANQEPISLDNTTAQFPAGNYTFTASYNYPQLTAISPSALLNQESQTLIEQQPSDTTALSFLSYTTKLTAGAWRFLTYFGRDTMIAALLLEPVLSSGENGAIEAVLAEVLERVDREDGSVCHEETIGDYATWLNLKDNITSTEPQCDYKMIDTDFYLPVLMEQYLIRNANGSSRAKAFLSTQASVLPVNSNLTYADLALISAKKIMNITAAFAAEGGQTTANMIHLKDNQIVGEWRDSTYGIGGGRIPYDVNTALVPAALHAIASLSTSGFFPTHPEWSTTASTAAQIWEDSTLPFFEITLTPTEATSRIETYLSASNFSGPSQASTIDTNITYHALALEGNNELAQVSVMNSDDCFRLFLLSNSTTTNQAQLSRFLNSTASNIRRRFPAGLMTDVGMLVANPAFGDSPIYAQNWTTSAYHGTVVWSWPLAMMARGLELQLSRCLPSSSPSSSSSSTSSPIPEFCTMEDVYGNVKEAYNVLWDSLEKNRQYLTTEVWSWTFDAQGDMFRFIELGELPPPAGQSPTESNIVQLWSLTFLAVTRNEAFK